MGSVEKPPPPPPPRKGRRDSIGGRKGERKFARKEFDFTLYPRASVFLRTRQTWLLATVEKTNARKMEEMEGARDNERSPLCVCVCGPNFSSSSFFSFPSLDFDRKGGLLFSFSLIILNFVSSSSPSRKDADRRKGKRESCLYFLRFI